MSLSSHLMVLFLRKRQQEWNWRKGVKKGLYVLDEAKVAFFSIRNKAASVKTWQLYLGPAQSKIVNFLSSKNLIEVVDWNKAHYVCHQMGKGCKLRLFGFSSYCLWDYLASLAAFRCGYIFSLALTPLYCDGASALDIAHNNVFPSSILRLTTIWFASIFARTIFFCMLSPSCINLVIAWPSLTPLPFCQQSLFKLSMLSTPVASLKKMRYWKHLVS